MNAAPGQGPAGHPSAPNGAQPMMYRPEMMRTIRFLTEDERGKYEKGLALLWKQHDATPAGSPENTEAKKKITDFGKILVSKIQQRRTQQAQQMQHQQPQQQPPGQPGLGGQQTQQAQSNVAVPQTMPSVANDTAAGLPPTPTTASTPSSNPATNAVTLQQQQAKLPPHLQNHINEMNFLPPASAPDKEKWVQDIKIKYGRALLQMEHARGSVNKLEAMIKERREKGVPLSAEEEKILADRKAQLQKQHTEAHSFVGALRKQYTAPSNGASKPVQNGAPPPGAPMQAGNQVRLQGQIRQGAGQPAAAQMGAPVAAPGAGGPMQHSTAAVNAAIEAAKNQQRMAGANTMPGQQGLAAHSGQVPTTVAQAQSPAVTQAPSTQHTAPQQHMPQPAQIKIEPGSQNPNIPAPLNTAIAAGLTPALQASRTPTQNSAHVQTPQSGTPANSNPQTLTHADAINKANHHRPGSISGPPGAATTAAPSVAGAQQGHPHAHPAATQPAGQAIQSKLPIAKTLPEKATQIPTPVSVMGGAGGGRPTYSGGSGIAGGVMNQPALAKTPAYQLEGEGERVLNKKKLDELVRQVCGGTAEGQEGNLLTPEVEEVRCYPLFLGALTENCHSGSLFVFEQ